MTETPPQPGQDATIAWFDSMDRVRHAEIALERRGIDSLHIEVAAASPVEDRRSIDRRTFGWAGGRAAVGALIGAAMGALAGTRRGARPRRRRYRGVLLRGRRGAVRVLGRLLLRLRHPAPDRSRHARHLRRANRRTGRSQLDRRSRPRGGPLAMLWASSTGSNPTSWFRRSERRPGPALNVGRGGRRGSEVFRSVRGSPIITWRPSAGEPGGSASDARSGTTTDEARCRPMRATATRRCIRVGRVRPPWRCSTPPLTGSWSSMMHSASDG